MFELSVAAFTWVKCFNIAWFGSIKQQGHHEGLKANGKCLITNTFCMKYGSL